MHPMDPRRMIAERKPGKLERVLTIAAVALEWSVAKLRMRDYKRLREQWETWKRNNPTEAAKLEAELHADREQQLLALASIRQTLQDAAQMNGMQGLQVLAPGDEGFDLH